MLATIAVLAPQALTGSRPQSLDGQLAARLRQLGFTGRIASTLPARLARPLDKRLANIGRLL